MAFSFTVNQSPATGAIAMYALIAKLIAQGWLKNADSDGTTYSATGAQVTSGNSGANGLGNDKAWVRLQRPDGGAELTIQRQAFGDGAWRIKYVEGGVFTAGSPGATQTPSNANEGIVLGSGTDAAPNFATLFGNNNTYKMQLGADGASPYGFWLACYPSIGSACQTAFVYEPLALTAPGETTPYVILCGNVDFAAGAIASSNPNVKGYLGAISSANFVQISGMQLQQASGNALFPVGAGANPWTTKDDGCPIMFGRPLAMGAPTGYKGVSTLLRWAGTQRAVSGDTAALASAKDRIIFQTISLPWDGATVPT